MDRLACVELPALPLQILRRAHPEWSNAAVVVVERELPHAPILWVDERAAHAGVVTGLSYAAAMARCATLRAGTVPAAQIATQIAALTSLLQRFSPHVEPSPAEAGIFWLDASGLTRLFASLQSWGEELVTCLRTAGFEARVAIGFRRFASYAAVKTLARERERLREREQESERERLREREQESDRERLREREHASDRAQNNAVEQASATTRARPRDVERESARKPAHRSALARTFASRHVLVLRDVESERALALELPLAQLHLPPRARDELFLLDVRDVGALVRLDEHGLAARFGPQVRALHRLAARELAPELDPVLERVPLSARVDFDLPEHALESLLAHVAELALALERRLSAAGRVLGSLSVRFELESPAATYVERIAPPGRSTSAATVDAQRARAPSAPPAASSADDAGRESSHDAPAPQLDWLLRLLRLRLSTVRFENGVHGLEVELEGNLRAPRTGELFEHARRRDPLAARRAFDALRALFGDEVVVRARLVSAHLPEARFTWEKLTELTPPRPAAQLRARIAARDGALPVRPAAPEERATDVAPARPLEKRARAEGDEARGQTRFDGEGSTESVERARVSERDDRKLAPTRDDLELALTRSGFDARAQLVRRILERPRAWKGGDAALARDDAKLALTRDDSHLALTRSGTRGPYRLSGGWWGREHGGVERDYYFVETHGGDLAWVFFDRRRDAWFLHGWIA